MFYDFSNEEKNIIEETISKILDNIFLLFDKKLDDFSSKTNN